MIYGSVINLILWLQGHVERVWAILLLNPSRRERITVNVNLNPYNFLVTYLHEVAHLEVYRQYKRRQPPHGKAWKTHFRLLLIPVMSES
jgi:hypothetical protein